MSSKLVFATVTGAGVLGGVTMACWCYCGRQEKSQTKEIPKQIKVVDSPVNIHQNSNVHTNELSAHREPRDDM